MQDVIDQAAHLGLPPQRDGESERDFRLRVAGELRAQGKLIEAQEIVCGRRWDDPSNPPIGYPGNPLTGVAGALACAAQGIDYGGPNDRRVEDDVAAGVVALAPPDPTKAVIAQAFDLLGPDNAVRFLGGGR